MLEELTQRPSAKVLIIANLLPLLGVIFWGWSVFNIVALYWMENLVLGVINILKMITCQPDADEVAVEKMIPANLTGEQREDVMEKIEEQGGTEAMMRSHSALKLFMIPFFTVHYFGFCAGHGFFVFTFFGKEAGGRPLDSGMFSSLDHTPDLITGGFALAALGLVASHTYSFFSNYIGRSEYKKTIVPFLMFRPYGRIVVLHVAIIFGGFAVMALGSPVGLLLILIIGKIAIDLKMHLREHSKAMEPRKSGSPLLDALSGRQG